MHVRRQLREAAAAALTGLPTTGARVYLGRHYKLSLADGPLLMVHANGGAHDRAAVDALLREIELIVLVAAQGGSDFEDLFDTIAAEVEPALEASAAIRALCKDFWLSADEIDRVEEGDTRIAFYSMIFTAQVMTPRGDPETLD